MNSLTHKKKYAISGLNTLAKKAWLEVREEESKLKIAKKSYKIGKKWVSRLAMSATMGIGQQRKLTDAFKARAATLKIYFETIFNYNMAWSNLSEAIGQEVDPILL